MDLVPIWRNGQSSNCNTLTGSFFISWRLNTPNCWTKLPPGAKTVAGFVGSQPPSCGAITLGIYLYHLWLTMKYLCPKSEWSWLLAISVRIKARGKPKPERHHLVTSDKLYRLGLELMDNAVASGKPVTSWRVQTAFRDGLAIALAAAITLRRRTLAGLRIGKQLKKVEICGFSISQPRTSRLSGRSII
jgi:hypothetical protein